MTAQHVISEYWDTELSKRKWAASAFVHLDRISKFLGDRRYCDVTISDVAAFVDAMAKESGISDSTINRALAVWHRMHNVAGETREYPVQRIAWSKLFRDEPEGRDRAISSEEIRKLLRAAPPHMQEIIAFAVAHPVPDPEALDAFTKLYPEHADALTRLAVELLLEASQDSTEPVQASAADAVSPAVARAISHYQNAVYELETKAQRDV